MIKNFHVVEIKRLLRSKFVSNTSQYFFASFLNAIIPFLLMPLLTRHMSTTDYGYVSMFGVLVGFTSPFVGLSTQDVIQRRYYDQEKYNFSTYLTTCFLILLLSVFGVSAVYFLFGSIINKYSDFPKGWLFGVIIVSISNFVSYIVLALWQLRGKSRAYGIYQVSQTILNLALTIWLVLGLGLTWKGRISAQLFTAIFFAILGVGILVYKGWINFKINIEYFKDALKFSIPLIPHALGAIFITMSDRFFITNMVGISSTGIYGVGYSFGSIIGFVEQSINLSYVPWLFGKLSGNSPFSKERVVKLIYLYFFIILIFAILLAKIAPWFLSFFVAKNFADASQFVLWISLGFAFSGMYKMVANFIFFQNKTKYLAWVTLTCGLLSLPLNYILILKNGALGAAQSNAVVNFLFFIFSWILSNKVYPMPWISTFKKIIFK